MLPTHVQTPWPLTALAIDEAAYGPDHPHVAPRPEQPWLMILQEPQARPESGPAAARTRRWPSPRPPTAPTTPAVAVRLNNLALILRGLGQPEGARPLARTRRWPSPRPPTAPTTPCVATDLSNLALILRDLGQPETARPLAERALAIDEAAYGPDHPTVRTLRVSGRLLLEDHSTGPGSRAGLRTYRAC